MINIAGLQFNWVDLVILVILAYFIVSGITHGFWVTMANFLAFLGALLISLRLYPFAAALLRQNFSMSHAVSNAVGFLAIAVVVEVALGIILGHIFKKFPNNFSKKKGWKLLGAFPSLGEGLILIAFILTLIVSLPVAPKVKEGISESVIGSRILAKTSGAEQIVNEIFGGVVEDSLTYLTVKPGSGKRIVLTTQVVNLSIDETTEAEMLVLINKERKERGKEELEVNTEALLVARAHAEDMWERKYFGHFSPEGKNVGDRLESAGVDYGIAGENLALAPTLTTAHTGLMNSEGHKQNILDSKFRRVAIGVIDNGIYGKMFVQIFTN